MFSSTSETSFTPAIAPNGILPEAELWSDEPPLESDRHRELIDLLIHLLRWHWRNRPDFYVSGNLTIYYNPQQIKKRDFRGPDIFVVLNANPRQRRSWTVWQEDGKFPNVIIELLSNSTARVDRGVKKQLYQNIWQVPDYFWFHPETLEFQGFRLVNGVYQAIMPNANGYLWSPELELYLGIHNETLRFFTASEELILSEAEFVSQQLNQTNQALQQERQRSQQLTERLRSLGIDSDDL
jgi:Uma2 family endonuclease